MWVRFVRAARRPGRERGPGRVRYVQRRLPDIGTAPRASFPAAFRRDEAMSTPVAPKVEALEQLLERVAREHAPVALASSLSAEDMVITDAILRHRLDIGIFTLDTGRLHADTLNVLSAIRERY